MKYTPMRLHPADIKHRHQQQNITNTNHPIPYLECQPPTVSLVPRPVAAPTTVTAYTSTTIHYHQHEARARACASTPAHVLVPVPTSSALRQYRHRQLSRHRYQLQSTSQQSPLHRQVTATIHQIQCIRRDRQHCNQPISYPASRPARQSFTQTDRPTIGHSLIHTDRLTVRRTHTNMNRTRPSILNASTSGDASHTTPQRRVRLT